MIFFLLFLTVLSISTFSTPTKKNGDIKINVILSADSWATTLPPPADIDTNSDWNRFSPVPERNYFRMKKNIRAEALEDLRRIEASENSSNDVDSELEPFIGGAWDDSPKPKRPNAPLNVVLNRHKISTKEQEIIDEFYSLFTAKPPSTTLKKMTNSLPPIVRPVVRDIGRITSPQKFSEEY